MRRAREEKREKHIRENSRSGEREEIWRGGER